MIHIIARETLCETIRVTRNISADMVTYYARDCFLSYNGTNETYVHFWNIGITMDFEKCKRPRLLTD